ncbi:hypothetical protein [Acinetobacter phage Ab69]|nr:hypothetical protein [Acinetobacter phage Ab69]
MLLSTCRPICNYLIIIAAAIPFYINIHSFWPITHISIKAIK